MHIHIIKSYANKVIKQLLLVSDSTTRGGMLYLSKFQHSAGFWFPVKKYLLYNLYNAVLTFDLIMWSVTHTYLNLKLREMLSLIISWQALIFLSVNDTASTSAGLCNSVTPCKPLQRVINVYLTVLICHQGQFPWWLGCVSEGPVHRDPLLPLCVTFDLWWGTFVLMQPGSHAALCPGNKLELHF